MPDGTTITAISDTSVTITSPSDAFPNNFIAANMTMIFRNPNEVACFSNPDQPPCPATSIHESFTASAADYTGIFEETDDDLNGQSALDAAFPGGYKHGLDGFTTLVGWTYAHSPQYQLAIVIGAPVSYTIDSQTGSTTCVTTVTGSNALSSGSANSELIHNVVQSLVSAFTPIGTSHGSAFNIMLDLDEPLNHAFYSFVGTTGGSSVKGTVCTPAQLAELAASILDDYQNEWQTQSAGLGLPQITFLVGGDEAPSGLYNSPTFASGDLSSFIDAFHDAAKAVTMPLLNETQKYYAFFLEDLGPTENDWKTGAGAVLAQSHQGTTCVNLGHCPLRGEIFAADYGGTPIKCPLPAYWQNNDLCASDAAAVAADQVKIQDFLKEASANTLPMPDIIRLSSYNHPSPSHLLPNSDPSSLTSLISWLFTTGLQGYTPPSTIFKLSLSAPTGGGQTNVQHIYESDYFGKVEPLLTLTQPWTAEYPPAEAHQTPYFSPNITLQALYSYTCNANSSYLSSFWSFDPLGQGTQVPLNCNPATADLLGYAAPYVAPNGDPCTLISGDGKAVKGYSLDCANLADVPIYAFVTTSTTAPKQYYYTSNPADIVANTSA